MIQRLVVIGCLATRIAAAAESSTIVTFESVPGGIEVRIGGKPFTTYHYANPDGTPLRRPYLYPVLADDGTPVTSDQFLVPKGDHPHHRSLWVGHGDVNGADHWGTNDARPGPPWQMPLGKPSIHDPMVVQSLYWDTGDRASFHETRRIAFAALPDGTRAITITSVFGGAEEGAIHIRLGDTKEAGLVAVRTAPFISASPVITASTGCAGERGCWGRPADWCDISGPSPAPTHGITVMSHPDNPRHPMRWHVRGYGLLAANPFGLSAFDGSPAGTGDMPFATDDGPVFRHLILVHRGRASATTLAATFDAFSGSADPEHPVGLVDNSFWSLPSPNSWWSFKYGVLTGAQDARLTGSVLESKGNYRDVIVELEYRYTGDVDSGVFLRAGQKWQCQIGISRSLQRDMTGSIYDPQRKYVAEARAAPGLNRAGEWNRLRIEARGDWFRHWLNGTLVLDYTDPAFVGEGPIGLQLHPGVKDMKIEFRNIRVLRLEPPAKSAGR